MEISQALRADLAALTDTLEDDSSTKGTLENTLRAFGTEATSTISSYLGMSIAMVINGYTIEFTTIDAGESAAATTSLTIPLPVLGATCDGQLVLFAATPGAFIDLAADLSFALNIEAEMLDQRITSPTGEHEESITGIGSVGMNDLSTLNRATGILLAEGHTRESARIELRWLAAQTSNTLMQCAQEIIDSKSGPKKPYTSHR